MKNKNQNTLYFILFLAVFAGILLCSESAEGLREMKKLGGLSNIAQNSGDIESIARFAVQQHNKNQNGILEFGRVVEAKEQVVAGKMYYLTLEVINGDKKEIYNAKVWVKPWMKFMQLEEFNLAQDNPLYISSDHGR